MAEYVKRTKENTDYPNANLWFVKNIKDKLASKNWNRLSSIKDEIVVLISDDYPYCYDTISLISKTFSDSRWEFKMTKYEMQDNPSTYKKNPKWYVYTWRMTKR